MLEGLEDFHCLLYGTILVVILFTSEQRQQRFGQSRQIPVGDRRLVGVGIATLRIDRTEYRCRIVLIHERTGAVVDGLTGQRHVVGIHHAVDKAYIHPARDQLSLAFTHCAQQAEVRIRLILEFGVMPVNDVVGQLAQRRVIATRGDELKSADTDVAGGHTRQHRTGQVALAAHRFAGGHRRQRARGGYAQRMHRLTDEVFTQHRAQRGLAVAATRKRRAAGTLECDVATLAVFIDDFTEQQRTAVAKLRGKTAELVAGIGLRNGCCAWRQLIAGEDQCAFRGIQCSGIQTQLFRQRVVELDQLRLSNRRRFPRHIQPLEIAGVGVVKGKFSCGHTRHFD